MEQDIIDKIRIYFKKSHVQKVWVFGSLSRASLTPQSDIDILIRLDNDTQFDLFDHITMIQELSEILNREVDLVVEGTLLPWVEKEVDNDKILIYERKIA